MAREDLIRLTPSANGSDGLDDPPCGKDDCPNVYRTASGSFVVQGAVSGAFDAPEGESLVEIPEGDVAGGRSCSWMVTPGAPG